MIEGTDIRHLMGRSLELPCGAELKNRLVKSAMSDSLADGEGNPTEAQIRLYERWAQGGVALSIIGEVQGDPRFPEKPGNLVFCADSDLLTLQTLARRASVEGAHIWPQLGHAGALSHSAISRRSGHQPCRSAISPVLVCPSPTWSSCHNCMPERQRSPKR